MLNKKDKPYKPAAGGWGALNNSLKKVVEGGDARATCKALFKVNQPDGFDCPGCAWPDPADPSMAEFCENGVKAVAAETTGRRVTPEFMAQHSVSELIKESGFYIEDQGRLTEPLRYNAETDHYERISWPAAFDAIGEKLKSLASPNEAVFYTSGRTSNEAAFLYQLFGRRFGTNNFPDCSNMCHESSGSALGETIGVGKGTVLLEDFEKADAIFVIGQNPGTNHPRMLTELQHARKRGAEIVSINPLVERGLEEFMHPQDIPAMVTGKASPISSLYLQPLIGGDLAVLKGIIKVVFEAEEKDPGNVLDHLFIEEHTSGVESLRLDIQNTPWGDILRESGLSQETIRKAAAVYLRAQSVIVCWAMGLTQHKHAVPTIQYIVNLMLLRGNLGRPGAGVCPVRGHSNVQGDRTMGIWEKPFPDFLDSLQAVFGFEPPREHGMDVVQAIHAMEKGEAKFFMGMGGNFVSASPDQDFTERAMRTCEMTVHVATKLNRTHLVHGKDSIILPCLGRTERDLQTGGEQEVTVEDSMSMVHASRGKKKPASPHLLSEPAIVAGIAEATLGNDPINWRDQVGNYKNIRNLIEKTIPGFDNFNQRLRIPGGFHLKNTAREREWNTNGSKAQFTVSELPTLGLPDGQLRLMTMRSHDQYNTTIYGNDDRYRGVYGTRMVIFMHAADIFERGMADGDLVNLTSHFPDGQRHAEGFQIVAYNIPKGCAGAYFPETNVLISVDSYADKSRTPTSKFVPVTIKKV